MAQHPDNLYLALGLRSRSTSDRAVVRLPRHDPASRMADPAKQDARVVGIKQYHKGVFKLTNAALDLDSQGEQPTKPPRVPRPPKLRATPARQITLTSHRVHTALAPDIWGTLSHSGKRGQALANYKGALQQIASGLAISCDDKGIYYIRNLIIVVVVVVAIPSTSWPRFPAAPANMCSTGVPHRCLWGMGKVVSHRLSRPVTRPHVSAAPTCPGSPALTRLRSGTCHTLAVAAPSRARADCQGPEWDKVRSLKTKMRQNEAAIRKRVAELGGSLANNSTTTIQCASKHANPFHPSLPPVPCHDALHGVQLHRHRLLTDTPTPGCLSLDMLDCAEAKVLVAEAEQQVANSRILGSGRPVARSAPVPRRPAAASPAAASRSTAARTASYPVGGQSGTGAGKAARQTSAPTPQVTP